jgi:hypothetical protein
MSDWTRDELTRIGSAEEIRIAPRRRDGKLRRPVTVWVVLSVDSLYVRSVNGRNSAWFRGVQETHEGRIWADDIEKDVTFVDAGHDVQSEVDDAYRAKYRRYAGRILNSVQTQQARSTTSKLVPRSAGT